MRSRRARRGELHIIWLGCYPVLVQATIRLVQERIGRDWERLTHLMDQWVKLYGAAHPVRRGYARGVAAMAAAALSSLSAAVSAIDRVPVGDRRCREAARLVKAVEETRKQADAGESGQ